jgi:Mn2+/Fe2+ NRAMP family transporter
MSIFTISHHRGENMSRTSRQSVYQLFGPGILFAAAAIGVSHLVQATRAGALYGLSMWAVLVLTCLAKYPVLRYGATYPAATGKSLLENYVQQGRWIAAAYMLMLLYSMWFVLAAITLTTAGLVQAVTGLSGSPLPVAAALLSFSSGLLLIGRYQWLEHVSKGMVALLLLLVVTATVLILPTIEWATATSFPRIDTSVVLFIIAVSGWMPVPVEGSVVTSAWTATRVRDKGPITHADSKLDFNTGYVASLVLALCFLILGAGLMHSSGVKPANTADTFARQVIGLFTAKIGAWSFYLIGAAAFATMFSTLLTILDGNPRQLEYLIRNLFKDKTILRRSLYPGLVVVYGLGTMVVLVTASGSFGKFIDLVTSLGFLSAPLIVVLNHRAVFSPEIPAEYRPSEAMRYWSLGGGLVIVLTSIVYFYYSLLH